MGRKLITAFNRAEDFLLAYFFLGLGLLIVVDILGRRLGLFMSFFWLEELGRHIMIFMTLLGACKAVKGRKHLSMNAFVRRLPVRWGHLIQGITDFACFAFMVCFSYYAWHHVVHLYTMGVDTSTLEIPFFIPYLPIALFGMGMFVRFLISSVTEFQAYLGTKAAQPVTPKKPDIG